MNQVFDNEGFLQSLGGDVELARELLEAYMEDSLARSQKLESALKEDDPSTAGKAAHSLKGMSGVVRAKPLVDMALEMEGHAKQGDLDRVWDVYSGFQASLASGLEEMKKFLDAN